MCTIKVYKEEREKITNTRELKSDGCFKNHSEEKLYGKDGHYESPKVKLVE